MYLYVYVSKKTDTKIISIYLVFVGKRLSCYLGNCKDAYVSWYIWSSVYEWTPQESKIYAANCRSYSLDAKSYLFIFIVKKPNGYPDNCKDGQMLSVIPGQAMYPQKTENLCGKLLKLYLRERD